jgi:hypothetical protein
MAAPSLLTAAFASTVAQVALANVVREYPGKPDHVLGGPADVRAPRALHPAFYGSFDWHSCVHMHWLLARVRRLVPDLPQRAAIAEVFDAHVTADNIAAECDYLARPESRSFERTYGWAWLLELAHELRRGNDAAALRWGSTLAPLAEAIIARYADYLPRQRYPLRHGLHANSAFGLAFALDYARAADVAVLERLCIETALRWFATDRDAPAAWEPSGADFLSPALMEADLMRRVLPGAEFARWLAAFLPGIDVSRPSSLFAPAIVDDRADPFIVHLDGLNLSRAWCIAGIAAALPRGDARCEALDAAAAAHRTAGMTALGSGEYAGEHWLATFAILALTAGHGPLPASGAC